VGETIELRNQEDPCSNALPTRARHAVVSGLLATAATAATGPPPPKTFGGAKVSLFATGLKNPTSFAFGDGRSSRRLRQQQRIAERRRLVLKNGVGVAIPDAPIFVGG